MEWLTHSQKKYCELCKTSFRFTKLYRQDMPQTLPTDVFIKKALIHVLVWLWWWARGALVVLTWGVILPWSMRFAWRAVFFISDGGFARDAAFEQMIRDTEHRNDTLVNLVEKLGISNQTLTQWAFGNNSSPITNLSTSQIMSAFVNNISHSIKTGTANLTSLGLLRYFIKHSSSTGNESLEMIDSSNGTEINTTISSLVALRRSSVLSDVHFLKNLSNYSRFNRFVMDVLEGQIITLLVVVAFVLIFLIREWVVQQQPMLNLQNFEADNAMVAPPMVNADGANAPNNQLERLDDTHATPEQETSALEGPPLTEDRKRALDWIDSFTPDIQQAMRQGRISDIVKIVDEMSDDEYTKFQSRISEMHREPSLQLQSRSEGSSARVRPGMPSRERSFLASQIRRSMEEGVTSDTDAEHTSLNSSDSSWQDIATSAEEEYGGESRKSKGKERALSAPSPLLTTYRQDIEFVNDDHLSTTAQSSLSIARDRFVDSEFGEDTETTPSDEAQPDLEDLHFTINQSNSDEAHVSEEETAQRVPQETSEQVVPEPLAAPQPQGAFDRLCDWFWGDMATAQDQQEQLGNDEHVVENLAEEAPFVPFANAQPAAAGAENALALDPQAAVAAGQAGLDPNDIDAVDDAEDLEGILELIGMQGPLVGLFQNVMFSACLISLSISIGVWLPYYQGKVVFMVLGNPGSLIRWPILLASNLGGVIVDVSILLLGSFVHWTSLAISFVLRPFGWISPLTYQDNSTGSTSTLASSVALAASKRLSITLEQAIRSGSFGSVLDTLNVHSHIRLKEFQAISRSCITWAGTELLAACRYFAQAKSSKDLLFVVPVKAFHMCFALCSYTWEHLRPLIFNVGDFISKINLTSNSPALDLTQFSPDLAYWSASDRAVAILTGYMFVALLGATYLSYGRPLFQDPKFRRIEAIVADALEQAGGVLKVILIISIEMIVFPLYCGLLLDLALLPLSENSTILSRIEFSVNKPWTSGFVHWFIGTCYMFHFALFVSMCRKIMRPGVLYFIRDPDDPTFHPVRDVLERSVTSQLRKIALSALVYGALVIFCLGSVVWSLDYLFKGLLPIRWFTNDPTIEFPLDLLFYSFITPFVLQIAKPSEGLHQIYTWWFKRCARLLRLSDFLFAESHPDEQGLQESLPEEDKGASNRAPRDGRFVRAPNSDDVRVPKGTPAFVDVDENNNRLDGKPEEDGIHAKSSEMTRMVYLPPYFRLRVGLFMFTIWVFAALTGVGVTIIPLISGRAAIHYFFQPSHPVNDVYAFTLGLYVLGSAIFVATKHTTVLEYLHSHRLNTAPIAAGIRLIGHYSLRALKIVYIYSMLAILGPLLCAALLECYILIPLHTYTGSGQNHAISVIQDWTLGVLYGRVFLMFFALTGHDGNSRVSRAARAVVQDGYLNPNARIATRCFLLPALLFGSVALGFPALVAAAINHSVFLAKDTAIQTTTYRLAYPALLTVCLAIVLVQYLARATRRWRSRIRDEVYLVGERLHNFGEKRPAVETTIITFTSGNE